LFAGGYTVLLLVWHYPPDQRFLLPLLPIVLAGLWEEARLLLGLVGRAGRAPVSVVAAVGIAFLGYWGVTSWSRYAAFCAEARQLRDACHEPAYQWIAGKTSPADLVLASEDALLYLYTDRKAITPIIPMRYFYAGDAEAAQRIALSRPSFARNRGIEYILDAPRDWWRELLPRSRELSRESHVRLARSNNVERVYAKNGCAVYKLVQ
jgi:hypothetical protein